MKEELKQFISYKNIIEGIEVTGFLDGNSFCGSFALRLSNGQKVTKSGVFKRKHTFLRENFVMDFGQYANK